MPRCLLLQYMAMGQKENPLNNSRGLFCQAQADVHCTDRRGRTVLEHAKGSARESLGLKKGFWFEKVWSFSKVF